MHDDRYPRRARRSGLAAALLVGSLAAVPAVARADSFVQTYLGAGVQDVDHSAACTGATVCVIGTETFNSAATGSYNGKSGLSSTFANNGAITGTITGDFSIVNADQYGGSGGTGRYITTNDSKSYSINLASNSSVPGVNYFGMWLSALDAGNQLQFYENNTLLYTYTPADLIKALGNCPSAYCGNPNTKQDAGEQFAYINFFDTNGSFNRIVVTELPGSGGQTEADDFTVGYRNPNNPLGTVVGPAPLPPLAGTAVGATAAAAFGAFRRLSRRRARTRLPRRGA